MQCEHVRAIGKDVKPSGKGCVEGMHWVHLRECLVCGYGGCCDSSVGKHATRHFKTTGHPVMKSIEPGEKWGWCYVDDGMLDL